MPVSAWIVAFAYDALAFVPQSLFGYYRDIHKNANFGLLGLLLLTAAVLMNGFMNLNVFLILTVLCLGNVLVHVEGAEATLRSSNGKMTPGAVFVGGGSFGVITGKLCSAFNVPFYFVVFVVVSAVPFVLLSNEIKCNAESCSGFNYAGKVNKYLVVVYSALIVIIRGYMGYGIPTSWNKTTVQHIIFYSAMGLGKCLGGVLIDRIGIRKTAILSIIGSIPFLLFGDRIMYLSIVGVAFFSMTMAITLALLVSVLPNKPGLAFGITTIGLFLGSAPIFFIKIKDFYYSCVMITVLSLLCMYMALKVVRNDDSD